MFHFPTLMIQISLILLVARVISIIFRKLHQPQVIGENRKL
jgi:Kef-type K+ transport system membrane component KefB